MAFRSEDESAKALGPEVIRVEGVRKTFPGGVTALDGVALSVRKGEVVVVVGPSGSGKSTLLRCLNGLEEIDAGSVRIGGLDLDHRTANQLAIRRQVGMVFQSFNLFPHLTVTGYVNLAQRLVRGRSEAAATAATRALLAKVGLTDKADAYPSQLSGGQQQRVAIARALAVEPSIMLFDEATSALDIGRAHV